MRYRDRKSYTIVFRVADSYVEQYRYQTISKHLKYGDFVYDSMSDENGKMPTEMFGASHEATYLLGRWD